MEVVQERKPNHRQKDLETQMKPKIVEWENGEMINWEEN